ncbi:MAG: 2-oxo acid dehydrogenase subunit E2 [Candidatus Hermodarchaeota archaeon]
MSHIGSYEERSFPKIREIIVETVEQGLRKHHMRGLLELDVTKAREYIKKHKKQTGETLSFTAWIIKCIGQAVCEYKEVHALRKGKKLIIFDDVDISVMVERIIEGKSFPVIFVLRQTNEKSFREIHEEIRKAQVQSEDEYLEKETNRRAKMFTSLPKFLRNFFFWRKLRKNPFFVKEYTGTVSVTSVGMFGKLSGWGIPITQFGLAFALGGIARKPGVVDDKIEIREYLCMTVLLDHDVVDGAPAARFISRLAELVESAFGLIEE